MPGASELPNPLRASFLKRTTAQKYKLSLKAPPLQLGVQEAAVGKPAAEFLKRGTWERGGQNATDRVFFAYSTITAGKGGVSITNAEEEAKAERAAERERKLAEKAKDRSITKEVGGLTDPQKRTNMQLLHSKRGALRKEMVDTLAWDEAKLLRFDLDTDYLYKKLLERATTPDADGFLAALESLGPTLNAIQEARGVKEGALVLGDADNDGVRDAIAAYLATHPTPEKMATDGQIQDFEYWAYRLYKAPKLTVLVAGLLDCQQKMVSRYNDVRRVTVAWENLCKALKSDAFAETYAALHKTAEVVAKNKLADGDTYKFAGFLDVMTKIYQPTNPDYKRRPTVKNGNGVLVTLCYFAAQLFGANTETMRIAVDSLESALNAFPENKEIDAAQKYAQGLAAPLDDLANKYTKEPTEMEAAFVAALGQVRPGIVAVGEVQARDARTCIAGAKKSINYFDTVDPVKEEALRAKLRTLVENVRIGIDQWELECSANPTDPEVGALCLGNATLALRQDLKDEAEAAAEAGAAAPPTVRSVASLDEAFGALQVAPVGEPLESVEGYFVDRSTASSGGGGGDATGATGGADWRARYLLTQLEARYEPVLRDLKLRAESDVLTACAVLAMSRIAPARA